MTTGNLLKRSAALVRRKLRTFRHALVSPAPVRPTVLIQSDDWGRTGMPSLDAIKGLASAGLALTDSAWDLFGLETADDLDALGNLLLSYRDAQGHNAIMSAVFVVANADLPRMQAEDYKEFHAVSLANGFPLPWQQESLICKYRQLIGQTAFYPALHGYTHFNPQLMLAMAREKSARGDRLRALHAQGIPYLASLTPEFNFALLDRSRSQERFIGPAEQEQWVRAGISCFHEAFNRAPVSTCAPGYRFNQTTCDIWARAGISIVHNAGGQLGPDSGVWQIPRNVMFEPVLQPDAFHLATLAAETAVARGQPIVICTHSINYVSRHLHKSDTGLQELSRLLAWLLVRYPDLRFTQEAALHTSWLERDPDWWRAPTMQEQMARMS